MNIYQKKLLLLLTVITLNQNALANNNSQPQSFRNLIMILDTNVEDISDSSGVCISHLISAIADKASPILVSTRVWFNYLERKQELSIHGAIENSDEAKAVNFMKALQDRISHWGQIMEANHIDQAQQAPLIAQAVNNEFYSSSAVEAMRAQGKLIAPKVAKEIATHLMRYAMVPFDPEQWLTYKVNDAYYLLIPKDYLQKCGYTEERQVHNQEEPFSIQELRLGLAIDHMSTITNPTDMSPLYLNDLHEPTQSFVDTLSSLFVPQAFYKTGTNPAWNIALIGHGSHHHIDENRDHCIVDTYCRIAQMTFDEFKKMLRFFDKTIHTNCFMYQTCYAGGEHSNKLFTTDGHQDIYGYTIISGCLNDNFSTVNIPELYVHERPLKPWDLEYNYTNSTWQYKLDYKNFNWNALFDGLAVDMHKFCYKAPRELLQILENAIGTWIENLPQVRLANSDQFSTYSYQMNSLSIDDALIAIKKAANAGLEIDTRIIVLKTPCIDIPITVKPTENPRWISQLPGSSVHYFSSIDATALPIDKALGLLRQPSGAQYDKTFFIKELRCSCDGQYGGQKDLGTKGSQLTCKNVLIAHHGAQYARIFFQNQQGTVFAAVGRNYQGEYTIRALAPLRSLTQDQYEKAIVSFESLANNPKRSAVYDTLLSHATETLASKDKPASGPENEKKEPGMQDKPSKNSIKNPHAPVITVKIETLERFFKTLFCLLN